MIRSFTAVISKLLYLRKQGGLEVGGEGDWLVSGAIRTHTFGLLSYMWVVCGTPKIYNSDINDHSQTIITKKIIMKIFEILQELPKCDTETQVSKCC